jgi:starch-binding outer membrane protein, SusD/RagB family
MTNKLKMEKKLIIFYRAAFFIIPLILIILVQTSCRKFVDVNTPPDRVTQENIFSNDQTAVTVITGIYGSMYRQGADISKYCGLLADELVLWSGADLDHVGYYINFLISNATKNTGKETWNSYYNFIFTCNAAIEGLNASSSLTTDIKKQLLGEAYFLRSWFYFYLVNLYGDVPLAVGTDPEINRVLARSSKQAVYQLIENDLLKAQELLNAEYVNGQLIPYTTGTSERVRPTKWAATALLARAYLYTGEYAKAETEASKVIAYSALFSMVPYANIFLKNNREAIWQLQPTDVGWNTWDARMFHLAAVPVGLSNSKPVYLSPFLLGTFENNDQRRRQWVDSLISGGITYYFPSKYKVGAQNASVTSAGALTEYSMMLRLSEQYLIRAEARTRLGNLPGAIDDLDKIRGRAAVPLVAITNPGISQSNLLNAILHERQVELFTEWGHRWFDLRRSDQLNTIMQVVTPTKGGTWESTDQLLPIPYNELLYSPNLTQNSGY